MSQCPDPENRRDWRHLVFLAPFQVLLGVGAAFAIHRTVEALVAVPGSPVGPQQPWSVAGVTFTLYLVLSLVALAWASLRVVPRASAKRTGCREHCPHLAYFWCKTSYLVDAYCRRLMATFVGGAVLGGIGYAFTVDRRLTLALVVFLVLAAVAVVAIVIEHRHHK